MQTLGPLRGATLTCEDAGAAADLYMHALGYTRLDHGHVSPSLAQFWQAPLLAGAAFICLTAPGQTAPWLRFIEQPGSAPAPFTTTGWAALELSVQDCDASIARLARAGFQIAGPPADLDFAEGALRAGQVRGPHGEMLYLTQINRQVPGYTLPQAQTSIDRIFIAILATTSLDTSLAHYTRLGAPENGRFQAAVPYIAEAQGLAADHPFSIATSALAPGHYLELDELPAATPARPRPQGLLPGGIALLSVSGAVPGLITGPSGEMIEIIS